MKSQYFLGIAISVYQCLLGTLSVVGLPKAGVDYIGILMPSILHLFAYSMIIVVAVANSQIAYTQGRDFL